MSPSNASAIARTVSRSAAASTATTATSGDIARAAVAVMPSRTPSAHAAREQATTTGACSGPEPEATCGDGREEAPASTIAIAAPLPLPAAAG